MLKACMKAQRQWQARGNLQSATTSLFCLSGQHETTLKMMNISSRHFFASSTGFDASLAAEMARFKVSPAAGWWLRSYGVLPSQVAATGPKGYIVKGDVLKLIKSNNLSLRPQEAHAVPAAAAPPKQE